MSLACDRFRVMPGIDHLLAPGLKVGIFMEPIGTERIQLLDGMKFRTEPGEDGFDLSAQFCVTKSDLKLTCEQCFIEM